jgi:hypothetical protein
MTETRSLHATPHRTGPHGGDGTSGPDGVKVPSQKTPIRRSGPDGRESPAPQTGSRESAALGVAGLPAEEIEPATSLRDPPGWHRHVPDLGWLMVRDGRDLRPDGVFAQRRPDYRRMKSPDVDKAASRPEVWDPVGPCRAETEAGTAVGTEVEGGGR